MSSEATPINPARFAEALKDLPLETLHFKGAEIRNSIAHLDYSNEQLKPFAEGTDPSCNGTPDQDCLDAIRENEIVIGRMQERIALLRAEVEGRGSSWLEFVSTEELAENSEKIEGDRELVNGTGQGSGEEGRSNPWSDGTFQTGRIVNGDVVMDGQPNGVANGTTTGTSTGGAVMTNGTGGRMDDEALRRAMEERMREMAADDEDGMHL
ncbi:hypothetical protein GLAREA_06768 [Glarea lozoyensis ATCC 20868]|uniref:Secondary alcohol dehydrogenase protein n=1 Tax=Glarea lozoyensis (strain ATCC 20868 / MF5171) TaxID=1116229 RepID=S3D7M9_GLAL2|nr:uncharacterized protein GLAREA_06768 [Glarea lozoyensis ATCC 20868]EPE33755.1 hypothetical protein GLAREA_06768 [Glarea lozoyensis ATCC 20868]